MKYAQYKNVPSRNGFYTKNYPRISREKVGSDHYQIAMIFALSIVHTCDKWITLYNDKFELFSNLSLRRR